MGQSQDNVIYIPLTLFHKHIAPTEDIGIFIKPKGGVEAVAAATDEVRTILRALRKTELHRRRSLRAGHGGAAADALARHFGRALPPDDRSSPGISLVVGAIVIANIMFVSVVERTKEIGVRRALGARRRDIRRQFLLEAALLSSVGGVIGVHLRRAHRLCRQQVFPAEVRPSFILLGVAVATISGVLAGWIPSNQASKLPPVEALRYE